MCARYLLEQSAAHVAAWLELVESATWEPPLDVRPTQTAPVVVHSPRRQGCMSTPMRFGLIPAWAGNDAAGRSLINARAETVGVTPAFRTAYERRRALVPVSAFVEWSGPKGARVAHRIASAEPLLLLAAVWESWTPPEARGAEDATGAAVRSFAIVTTAAHGAAADVHDRMPVLVPPELARPWLLRQTSVDALVAQQPALATALHAPVLDPENVA